MSREFGSYENGYFHDQLYRGASDCLNGREEITRKWGAVLMAMEQIAVAISSAEACDSCVDYPILQSMADLPNVCNALKDVEDYLKPFKRVAEEAVRKHASA